MRQYKKKQQGSVKKSTLLQKSDIVLFPQFCKFRRGGMTFSESREKSGVPALGKDAFFAARFPGRNGNKKGNSDKLPEMSWWSR